MNAVLGLIDEIAVDVGRLRRRLDPGSSAVYAADRIADRVVQLSLMLQPNAAEIAACTFPGDDETIDAAIDVVDRRVQQLRGLLGFRGAA